LIFIFYCFFSTTRNPYIFKSHADFRSGKVAAFGNSIEVIMMNGSIVLVFVIMDAGNRSKVVKLENDQQNKWAKD